jgi:hypothetical protein
MASKPASDSTLGLIHNLTAEWAISLLEGKATAAVVDKETGEVTQVPIRPSAADIAVIRAFLKDNNITCVPSDDNAIGRLQKTLEDKQNRRKPTLPKLDDPDAEYQFGPPAGMQ